MEKFQGYLKLKIESEQNIENQDGINQDTPPGRKPAFFVKLLTITSLLVIVLVLAGHFLLFFFAKPILQPELEALVNKNGKKYQILFGDLTINLMNASIQAEDISVTPVDTTALGDSASFKFSASQVQIKGLNIWHLLFGKRLICHSFSIFNPNIELHSKPGAPGNASDQKFNINRLHRRLLPVLNEISIQELTINKGQFALYKHQDKETGKVSLRNFDLFFENILIDSISHLREQKILFSDSVFINLDETTFELQKENSEISVESIILSAKNSSITLKNVVFGNRESLPGESYFRTRADRVSLTGIGWNDLPGRKLKADSLLLVRAGIVLDNRNSGKKPTSLTLQKAGDIFYDALSPYFDVFSINELQAINLKLDMNFPAGSNIKDIDIFEAGVVIHNLSYDRLNVKERSRFLFADNFEISMKNQRVNLPGSGSSVVADSMMISGITSRIYLRNLKWIPEEQAAGATEIHPGSRLLFPEINIEAENLKELILYRNYHITSLTLKKPELSFQMPDSSVVDTVNINDRLWELANRINKALPGLYVRTIMIDSAGFGFSGVPGKTDFQSGRFTATLMFSQLQPGNKNHPDSVPFKVADYRLDLGNLEFNTNRHSIKGESIRYYQSDSILEANEWLYLVRPVAGDSVISSSVRNIQIGRLSLGKCSLDNLIRKKEITSGKLAISHFQLEISHQLAQDSSVIADLPVQLPFAVQVDTLLLEKGRVSITGNGNGLISGTLYNLGFSSLNLRSVHHRIPLRFTSPELQIDSARFETSGRLQMKSGHIFISAPDSLLFVENPEVLMNSNYAGYNNRIGMSTFAMEKFSVEEFLNDRVIAARTLLLRAPEIKLIAGTSMADSMDFSGKTMIFLKSLVKQVPLIQLSEVRIENGSVFVTSPNNPARDLLISNGTYLTSKNVWIDEFSEINPSEILFSSGHQFTSKWLRIFLPDSIHYISVDNVQMSTDDLTLSTGKMSYKWLPGIGNLLQKHNHRSIETSGLRLKGIDYGKMYAHSEVLIDSILLQPPTINIYQTEKTAPSQQVNLITDLKPVFDQYSNRLKVGHLSFSDGKMRLFLPENNSVPYVSLYPVGTVISGISSDKGMETKLFNADDIRLDFKGLKIPFNDSLYTLSMSSVRISSADSVLQIDSVTLLPEYSREAFYNQLGIQTDYYDLSARSVRFSGFDIRNYLKQKDIRSSSVKVDKLKGIVYRNKTYPVPPGKKTELPVSMLMKYNHIIDVDSIMVNDSRLLYEEQLKDIEYPGSISFEEMNILLKNLTNDSASRVEASQLQAELSARLMGKGFLNAGIIFPYDSLNDFFRVKAVLKSMPLSDFNPFLNNLAFVHVKDGYNKMAIFNFWADSSIARGKVDFRYSDLKIRLIDRKTLRTSAFDESAASFLANLFVVRTNNPRYGVLTRKGKIYFERDLQKSILNYLAKSALSGVVSTIRGSDEEKKELRIKKREIKKLKGNIGK